MTTSVHSAPSRDRLSAYLVAHAGLALPDWMLESRMQARASALGLGSTEAYVDLVISPRGAAELEVLLEAVRVGETRFFRHAAHVEALVDAVIPGLRARPHGAEIKAWSAGCASGEEAYTLAMILAKLLPRPRWQVSVLATDLSARALDVARRGEYPESAVAHVPEKWRRLAFVPAAGGEAGRWRVAPDIARLVSFARHNLIDTPYPRAFDIIWCRNVLIYFAPEARRAVVSRLLSSLRDDGVLFVGYSENLRDQISLEPVRTAHAVIYRKTHLALAAAGPEAESRDPDKGQGGRR